MKLEAVSFEEKCPSIKHKLHLETTDSNRFRQTLIVSFVGEYRPGSSGNPDAQYMAGILHTAHEVWRTNKVIIDLSDLKYEWGDEMIDVLYPFADDNFTRMAIVVGPHCRRAISTLCLGLDSEEDITIRDEVFDRLEDALAHVQKSS